MHLERRLLLKAILLLGVTLGHVDGECKAAGDGWNFDDKKCPSKFEEIYLDKDGKQTLRWCCTPDDKQIRGQRTKASGCRLSQCSSGIGGDLCSTFDERWVKGKKMSYEEISRDSCTRDGGIPGTVAYCCGLNSTEGMLATFLSAEPNEFPHQAKLQLPGHCGGTVYNKKYIITASHCIVGKETRRLNDISKMKVILGTNLGNMNSKEYVYGVKRAIPHPQYSRLNPNKDPGDRFVNDIALLELDREIVFSPKVKALEIAPKGFKPTDYASNAVIVGWGTTDTLSVSDHLQKANFIIRSDEGCFKNDQENGEYGPYHNYKDKGSQLICVGGIFEGKWSPTAGGGDSGGPAICRAADGKIVLCGVTSFGRDDEECLNNQDEDSCPPSVYAEVAHFHKWIKDNAGEQDPSTFYKPYLYGQPVPKGQFEHQVQITSADGKPCGGTLIAPDVVVTAAQCVVSSPKVRRSGIKVITQKGKSIGIKEVATLPDFKRTGSPIDVAKQGNRIRITDNYYTNDMAILRLNEKVNISPEKLAVLPSSKDLPAAGIEVARPRDPAKSERLAAREFRVLDKGECQTRMNRLSRKGIDSKVDKNILCGVEKYSGGSTCDRELGGGLICRGPTGKEVLCGVQVFRLCEWSVPNGFIHVGMYTNWLNSAMKQI